MEQVNATSVFLGNNPQRACMELYDVQGLWGGRRIYVAPDKVVVQRVLPGMIEHHYEFALRSDERKHLLDIFIENDFMTISPAERQGIPDEARLRMTLVNAGGDQSVISKWAGVKDDRFDIVYSAMVHLETFIADLVPVEGNMSKIESRKLGRSGIEVSALGMGCWAIGGPFWSGETPHGWGEVDDTESIRAIHTALDLGVTLFDTANVYGAGHSERVLGQAIAGSRERVVIATKFNAVFDETTRQVTGSDTSAAGIRAACEASLHRLNTDYIDLYQFHDNGYPADKAEPVRETLESLVKEGKIRAYGWSTDFPERLEVFAQGPKCAAVQLQLNVLDDNPAILALCDQYDLAALNRGPLAMGLLTDKYNAESQPSADDVRGVKSPEWMKYFKGGKPSPEWLHKRDAIRQILMSNGRSVAQGALAWLWARSEHTLPIPGFRTSTQVKENAGAMDFGPLTADQMTEIDGLLDR